MTEDSQVARRAEAPARAWAVIVLVVVSLIVPVVAVEDDGQSRSASLVGALVTLGRSTDRVSLGDGGRGAVLGLGVLMLLVGLVLALLSAVGWLSLGDLDDERPARRIVAAVLLAVGAVVVLAAAAAIGEPGSDTLDVTAAAGLTGPFAVAASLILGVGD